MTDLEFHNFEERLARMQPMAPSGIARQRIRTSIERFDLQTRMSWRRYVPGLVAAAVVAMIVWLGLSTGRPTTPNQRTVVGMNSPVASVQPPTMASYFRAAELPSGQLDALLSRQSAVALPTPTSAIAGRRLSEP